MYFNLRKGEKNGYGDSMKQLKRKIMELVEKQLQQEEQQKEQLSFLPRLELRNESQSCFVDVSKLGEVPLVVPLFVEVTREQLQVLKKFTIERNHLQL